MAPTYKLTYFNLTARGEPIRWIFSYAGVPFEDNRIERENWAALKATLPWESMPLLEIDGQQLGQSGAIVRYLGQKFNLAGDNDFESAKCDEMFEAMSDLVNVAKAGVLETDEEKKKELVAKFLAETVPKFYGKWNEILEKNGEFLVGERLSYADIVIASFVEFFKNKFGDVDLLTPYPALTAHQAKVANSKGIKEWIANRP